MNDHTWHVIPVDDDLDHFETGTNCWCGPDVDELEREDGGVGYVVTHHALDGRKED